MGGGVVGRKSTYWPLLTLHCFVFNSFTTYHNSEHCLFSSFDRKARGFFIKFAYVNSQQRVR